MCDITSVRRPSHGGANSKAWNQKNGCDTDQMMLKTFEAMRAYDKAFPASEGPCSLPSRAEVLAKRKFDSPEKQAAWDGIVQVFTLFSPFSDEGTIVS